MEVKAREDFTEIYNELAIDIKRKGSMKREIYFGEFRKTRVKKELTYIANKTIRKI